jgi:hypothetical protein
MENVSLLNLSPSQLRRAAEVKEQIDRLNDELGIILGEQTGGNSQPLARVGSGRRQMSAAGRARIAAAARTQRRARGGPRRGPKRELGQNKRRKRRHERPQSEKDDERRGTKENR